jgi:hypothetical protein
MIGWRTTEGVVSTAPTLPNITREILGVRHYRLLSFFLLLSLCAVADAHG